ncbi:hypothetical protein R7S55_005085, partial [Raoultella ornithinolytica]|nr:hypothetical protein [Raoultella ornithinolytica]ELT0734960.1 hypothetical protein [Raoultella ornithinolytica]
MAEVPLPTPTQAPVPSTDIRNAVFAGAKLDEEVTGSGEFYTDRLGVKRLTNTGRNNQFNAAQQERTNQFQQFLLSSGYAFLGDYEDGPFQFGARNQYIRYDNQYYRLNATTDVGFTTTGTDATSFASDVTHFVLMDGDTLRQNLGSGEGLKYIGFCNSLGEMRAVIPDQINQKISLLGVSSGDVAGGGEFISVNATDYPADNQGVCFSSANPALNWYRLRVMREKIIYLEDFGAIESVVPDMIDCSIEIGAALTWPTKQANGVFKIKSRGCLYKVSSFLGLIDFAYTQIDFDGNVTFYAPTPVGSNLPVTLMEWVMTTRNSVEGAYQGRNLIVKNLSIKATARATSQVTAVYVHDMWGVSFELNTHGIARSFLMGSNIWCFNILGKLSAECIFDNSAASTNAGENISLAPGTILYNSGQCADLSHHQFFVNMLGVSVDYTPGRNGKPVFDLGNSVVYHVGGHTEYAGPSSAPFVRATGDLGMFSFSEGTLLLVVDSSSHYDYFAEMSKDYKFSIKNTTVFGTRVIPKAICNRKMYYSPNVNFGSSQNNSCISDNGGNVLYDPTFSAAAIKDKWHVVGGTQTDRFTTAFAAISVVAHSNAGSGYALKISKLVTGAGNNVSVRLEVKSKNVFLSPRISFKIESSADVTGQVITNLNPWLVNMRDAYGIALSAGRVMTSQTP